MEELVSVIIPTYKRDVKILIRAINSVLNQSYRNLEIIVVNDCPEDKNLEKKINNTIKEINNSKIQYICLDKNSGACVARNVGIQNSKGKYIALLDDDDEWTEDKIEKQMNAIKTSDNIGLVYQNYIDIDKYGRYKEIKLKKYVQLSDLLKYNIIGGTSMPLIRKKCFDEVGMFDKELKSSQDFDMWIRIAKKFDISYIDEPLVKYYYTEGAITRDMQKRLQGWERLIDKNIDLYNKDKNSYNYLLNIIVYELMYNGYYKKAFIYLKRAMKVKFFTVQNGKVFMAMFRKIKDGGKRNV